MREYASKIIKLPELLSEIHTKGIVVFTNGCFDIVHSAHVKYLQQARLLGNYLIVAVNGDLSVKRLKGKDRPIINEQNRMELIAALECVDYVILMEDDLPNNLIAAIKPHIHCKGGDYTIETMPETQTVINNGGMVKIIPYIENNSTTDIINKIKLSI
jgi:glycerol-3-phosphate cytidylyltransferase